jgi:hypothetical protein
MLPWAFAFALPGSSINVTRFCLRDKSARLLGAALLVVAGASCNERTPLPPAEVIVPSALPPPSPSVGLFGLSLSPPGLFGTAPGIGTAILTRQAPTGGVLVSLSSGEPSAAIVPASVTIPEGSDRAAFPIATQTVTIDRRVPITASAMGTSTSGTLEVWAVLPSFFSWFSDPGEPIGRGAFGRITTGFTGSGSDTGATITITPQTGAGTESWRFRFLPPRNVPMHVARYDDAMNSPTQDPTRPIIDIAGRGISCGIRGTGWFEIREFAYLPSQNLLRFDAVFEQHCDGSAPALRGEVRFTASGR